MYGAGDEVRTRDIYLGKVMLYQLSYSRIRVISKRFTELRFGYYPVATRIYSSALLVSPNVECMIN